MQIISFLILTFSTSNLVGTNGSLQIYVNILSQFHSESGVMCGNAIIHTNLLTNQQQQNKDINNPANTDRKTECFHI